MPEDDVQAVATDKPAAKAPPAKSASEAKTDPKGPADAAARADAGTKTDGAKAEGGAKPQAKGKPASKAAAVAAEAGESHGMAEELIEKTSFDRWIREALFQMPSWLVSMVVHMIVLLVLALWMVPETPKDVRGPLVVAPGEKDAEDLEELEEEPLEQIDVTTDLTALETPMEDVQVSPADDMEAAAIAVELSEFGLDKAPRNDLLATVGAYTGTGLSGRGEGNRAGLVKRYGGSEGSEKAVAAALKWLAMHQCPDGGWNFDMQQVPSCRGQCRNSGAEREARIAATGLALLPFLGAGQTHKTGKYESTVKNGLYFLVSKIKLSPQGGALNESGGSMYSHGIASIALCEAYAMTHDKSLHDPAQAAVNFICYAQDPVGGGWRYQPRQPGDTSVVGWQIMALKSGQMAYLTVNPATLEKAKAFLKSVSSGTTGSIGGGQFGYTSNAGVAEPVPPAPTGSQAS